MSIAAELRTLKSLLTDGLLLSIEHDGQAAELKRLAEIYGWTAIYTDVKSSGNPGQHEATGQHSNLPGAQIYLACSDRDLTCLMPNRKRAAFPTCSRSP